MSSKVWWEIAKGLKFPSANEKVTCEIAKTFAASLKPGDVVALSGELGAGKSVFCRAVMRALGVNDTALPSPTFSIIQEYDGKHCRVAHMDWYRLADAEEVTMLGLGDYFQAPWICLIEWAERADGRFPERIRVNIDCVEGDLEARLIEITPAS